MRPFFRIYGARSRRAAALIVVLAFVALLAVLVLGFLTSSFLNQQISSTSANRSKVDLFADGAVDCIIGDLKQEIADGSTSSGSGYTVYTPKTNFTMVPYVALNASVTASAVPNLVKMSASGVAPYTGSNYTGSGTLRASNALSTTASLNSRYVSLSDWNQALLLPMKTPGSTTDFTPAASTGFTATSAPSWILVSKNGSNPTSWSSALEDIPANKSLSASSTTATQVIGRYAYTIYDEGGLLDANVAGFPSTSTASQYGYKNAETYADLTQLPGFSSLSNAQAQTDINQLVGWRNYATAQPSGTFPSYSFSGTTQATNFFNMIVGNASGFLRAANTSLVSNQSDHMFSSRQQLIQFMESVDSANLSSIQTALQYLGTFSRGLSQPSYLGHVSGAPTMLKTASGGNNIGAGGDAIINPSFLSARVSTSFTRNDSSKAVVNDPLINKRFALSRLAWITCNGPLADDNGNLNPSGDSNIATEINILENTYGYSAAYLGQGGPTNIYKYFGLSWVTDTRTNGDTLKKWVYNHEKAAYLTSLPTSLIPIRTLSSGTYTVTSQKRDADFFELLKAALDAGSLGKSYYYAAIPNNTTQYGYQQTLDNWMDGQIIQIGANIINQANPDSYARRILYADGGTFGAATFVEFRGVVDAPYLYRVREAKIMIADSSPPQATLPSIAALVSPGSGVVLQEPEIWNPHAWSGSVVSNSNPRPTQFRLVAISTDPNSPSSSASPIWPGVQWRFLVGSNATTTATSAAVKLTEANTALTFTIDSSHPYLFREPTLLIKPNVPTGSSLTGSTTYTSLYPASQYSLNGVADNNKYVGIYMGTVPMAWVGSLPVNSVGAGLPPAITSGSIPAGYAYYPTAVNGITYRLQYQDASGNWVTYDEKYTALLAANSYNTPSSRTAYNSIFYTNETFNIEAAGSSYADNIIGSEWSQLCIDPRTSHFGMIYAGSNGRGLSAYNIPLGASVGRTTAPYAPLFVQGWAAPVGSGVGSAAIQGAAQQNALLTTRMDGYQGMVFSTANGQGLAYGSDTGPSAAGFGSGYTTSSVLRPGLFSQNNPNITTVTSVSRYSGDGQTPTAYPNQYFADADGVVRRAMGAYIPISKSYTAVPASPAGEPFLPSNSYSGAVPTTTVDNANRPLMLNRPFRSVGDLAYCFSGTPWRNLDFNTPESGAVGLLDVFCVNDTDNSKGLVAGKVNLNTRQSDVLKAVLNGTYKDEFSPGFSTVDPPVTTVLASSVSNALIARTSSAVSGLGPLQNISELVGKWNSSVAIGTAVNGGASYTGFTSDTVHGNDLDSVLSVNYPTDERIERFREATIRALANVGQVRVWNLMIDVVAQTGRYPASATGLNNFMVEGQKHYWVHIAMDRYTGQVMDRQIEVVKE